MAEAPEVSQTSELLQTPKKPGITRKTFLKAGTAATAVVATAGIVNGELVVGEKGVKTSFGTFIPLYEAHEVGINPEDVPANTDIFFREYAISNLLECSHADLAQILKGEASAYTFGQTTVRPFTDNTLVRLAKNNIEIMFGDVDIPRPLVFGELIPICSEAAIAMKIIIEDVYDYLDRRKNKEEFEELPKITRREFFKKSIRQGFKFWGISHIAPLVAHLFAETPDQTVLKRISARINGLEDHLHPELVTTFIRNLVMADKLLLAGQDFVERNGKLPLITYQAESGHSGIEDLLRLSPDFCRMILLTIPKPLLNSIIEYNGGVDDFVSARFIKLWPFLENGNLAGDDGWRALFSPPQDYRQISDTVLKKMLES